MYDKPILGGQYEYYLFRARVRDLKNGMNDGQSGMGMLPPWSIISLSGGKEMKITYRVSTVRPCRLSYKTSRASCRQEACCTSMAGDSPVFLIHSVYVLKVAPSFTHAVYSATNPL